MVTKAGKQKSCGRNALSPISCPRLCKGDCGCNVEEK
jgi:hypothetical protein